MQFHSSSDTEPGRSRKRRRDFFGTIRKRLNRSRGRGKSSDRNAAAAYNGDSGAVTDSAISTSTGHHHHSPSNRSVSADRARDTSTHSAHSTGAKRALLMGARGIRIVNKIPACSRGKRARRNFDENIFLFEKFVCFFFNF